MRRTLVIAVVGLLAEACSGGPTAAPAVPQVFNLTHDAAAGIAPVDPNRAQVAPADQLRLILEQQMAWHGITLVEAMRAAEAGNGVSTKAWIRQLSENTDDLVHSIGLAYGPVGARAFQQQWAQHTQFLVDYATAVGRGDRTAENQAKADLADYVRDQGSFLSVATGGRLSAKVATHVLTVHVADMIAQVDAAARSDRATSTRIALDDHTYLNGVADDLTGAIAAQEPAAFPGVINTASAVYCSAANQSASAALITNLGRAPKAAKAPSSSSTSGDRTPALHLLGPLGPVRLGSVDGARRAVLDQAARSFVTARHKADPAEVAAGAKNVLDEVAKLAAATAPP
jgi:hypothetical protein